MKTCPLTKEEIEKIKNPFWKDYYSKWGRDDVYGEWHWGKPLNKDGIFPSYKEFYLITKSDSGSPDIDSLKPPKPLSGPELYSSPIIDEILSEITYEEQQRMNRKMVNKLRIIFILNIFKRLFLFIFIFLYLCIIFVPSIIIFGMKKSNNIMNKLFKKLE